MRACAKEMLALYPDLIAKYEELGAIPLVAAFCTSAASTAKFTGALDQAGRWYQRAVAPLRAIEQVDRARWALEQCEQMLKPWTDALLQNREFARALPELLLLIDVAEELGHRGVCASAAINGAILLLHVSRDAAGAKRLAERALALPPDDASEVARARAVLSQCDGALAGP
jgi:hypothetical protein